METGLCQCGCGGTTQVARQDDARYGSVKGQPRRFIKGHDKWRGERKVTVDGYVLIYAPDHPRVAGRPRNRQYVFEHILVVEKALGHVLPPGAVVHHINQVRDDNRLENLQVMKSDQEHREFHHRLNVLKAGGDPETQRICCGCKVLKGFGEFYPGTGRRFHSICKACCAAKAARRRITDGKAVVALPPYAA